MNMKTNMKTNMTRAIWMGVIAISFSACVSSVSTSTVRKQKQSTEQKGRVLLDEAWTAQNMDRLSQHKVYEFIAVDHWKGALGKLAKIWPENESKLHMKYAVGNFDGQVDFLDGKKAGTSAGLQSWKYYEKDSQAEIEFKKSSAKIIFGLNAYHYFFELIDRLKSAPLVAYAGEKQLNGQSYDLVLVTWKKFRAHKKHDQYTAWINKETKLMDHCEFTIHDSFLPGGSMLPGSISFSDFKDIGGVSIPFLQYVYLGGPKSQTSKYLHRLTIESFSFDSFNENILYPDSSIEKMGDSKPE